MRHLIKRAKSRFNQKIKFLHDTNQVIQEFAINNGLNTQVKYILSDESDGNCFKENVLSGLTKPVELSHEWVLTHFNYQEQEFYARLLYESDTGTFEIPPYDMKVGVIRKSVYSTPKFYVLHEINRFCVFCSLLSEFFFVDDKIASIHFKDESIPSLK